MEIRLSQCVSAEHFRHRRNRQRLQRRITASHRHRPRHRLARADRQHHRYPGRMGIRHLARQAFGAGIHRNAQVVVPQLRGDAFGIGSLRRIQRSDDDLVWRQPQRQLPAMDRRS